MAKSATQYTQQASGPCRGCCGGSGRPCRLPRVRWKWKQPCASVSSSSATRACVVRGCRESSARSRITAPVSHLTAQFPENVFATQGHFAPSPTGRCLRKIRRAIRNHKPGGANRVSYAGVFLVETPMWLLWRLFRLCVSGRRGKLPRLGGGGLVPRVWPAAPA